jgi:hypothetical protein
VPLLGEQAALETALMTAIRSQLGYVNSQCARTHKGQPEPRCGNYFVSVWSPKRIDSNASTRKTALDLTYYVNATVTVRFTQPWDRWVIHDDDLAARGRAIIALGHQDIYNYAIVRAANILAGYRTSSRPDGVTPVGFCEALWFQGADDMEEQGPDWFHAALDSSASDAVGVSQTLRFGGARRVQALKTMS